MSISIINPLNPQQASWLVSTLVDSLTGAKTFNMVFMMQRGIQADITVDRVLTTKVCLTNAVNQTISVTKAGSR